jgi:cytochrome c-type biogenesis protein CcmH
VRRLLLALALALPTAAAAVEPQEILADPELEARARAISDGLRCPVCRNESIDESVAPVAQDMRGLVRELLLAGASDAEVIEAMVARYGEYVLLRPRVEGANLLLWLSAPVLFLAAIGLGAAAVRARARAPGPEALTPEERARLEQLLNS